MNDAIKAYLFQNPDTLPISIGFYLPTWHRHGDALQELVLAHPRLFPGYKKGDYEQMKNEYYLYQPGIHYDHWGCKWNNVIEGHDSICIGHPVNTLEDAKNIGLPEKDIGLEHGLVFLRYTYLRGYENAMIDFAEENEILSVLMGKVLAYAKRQTEIAIENAVKNNELFIHYADDLGMQNMLPTGPERWLRHIGPCYKELFAMCKAKNKMISMHSDGCIYEIIPYLREFGLDAINPQFRANTLEKLVWATRGRRYNKIAVILDLDRQFFPVATPDEIEEHMWECVEALALPEGGLSLYAEISEDIPLENIGRIAKVAEKITNYYAD